MQEESYFYLNSQLSLLQDVDFYTHKMGLLHTKNVKILMGVKLSKEKQCIKR